MAHEKHTALQKPKRGFFARNEISILGSNCNKIKNMAHAIAATLHPKIAITYVDADHAREENQTSEHEVFAAVFTDKITFSEYQLHQPTNSRLENAFYDATALTLINGNHNRGSQQIVLIDPKKEASLIKRKEALTQVLAIVGKEKDFPSYIKECIPHFAEIPFFLESEVTALSLFIAKQLEQHSPPIKGLILAGGKSSRMGTDKAFIAYHGQAQHLHLQSLLDTFCESIAVSCSPDQAEAFEHPLTDTFLGLGPMGGILSAFRSDPNAAWLTVPCDVPLLDLQTLEHLIELRNPSKMATSFLNSSTGFPEPLITLWEPKAYPILLEYLSMGYSCPRKVLINSDVELVNLEDQSVLFNANTLDEQKEVVEILSKKIDS